jgi:hypothetical protein
MDQMKGSPDRSSPSPDSGKKKVSNDLPSKDKTPSKSFFHPLSP